MVLGCEAGSSPVAGLQPFSVLNLCQGGDRAMPLL